MKKHILLVFGLFVGLFPAFAQMMPDSTVQVVAYWELGDKHVYQMESAKYKVEQGDTTVVEKSAELLQFEVVAADEEKGYRIKVTSLDKQNSNPTLAAISEKMRERFGEEAYYFETSPYGEFLKGLPIEGLEEQADALVQEIAKTVQQKSPGVEADLIIPLIRQMISPETLTTAIEAEYSPLFAFHGSRLDIKGEYSFEDTIPSLIGDGVLKMDSRFWVDEELSDEYSVVLRVFKQADEEQTRQMLVSILGGMLQAMAPDEDARAEVEEVYKDARMSVEDYLLEEIHLGTGWPIAWRFTRETNIEMDGKQQGQIVVKSFEIIVEEE